MMKEEFDKMIGFETRYEEYREIEKEYMGTDTDKVRFAAKWKKNDGIARLARMRTREIEEQQGRISQMERDYVVALKTVEKEKETLLSQVSTQAEEIAALREKIDGLNTCIADMTTEKEKLQRDFNEMADAIRVLDRVIFHRQS
jgi:chromosome segregation ATPase